MQSTKGFTIIEVLIAITLLSVLVLVVITSLTSSFRLSSRTTFQTSSTNSAQATIEAIRGQWQSLTAYKGKCVSYTLPSGTSVSVQDETVNGTPYGAAYSPTFTSGACSTSGSLATPAPLRRVTVTTTNGTSGDRSQLIVEIAAP